MKPSLTPPLGRCGPAPGGRSPCGHHPCSQGTSTPSSTAHCPPSPQTGRGAGTLPQHTQPTGAAQVRPPRRPLTPHPLAPVPGGQSRVHTHTPNSCCVGLPPTGTITSTLRKLTGGHWGTVCLVAIRPHGTGSLFPRPHLSDAACWPSGVRRVPPCTAQGGVWLQKVTEQDSPGSPTEAESRRKVRLRIDNDAHLHCGPQPARGCFLKVRSESYSFA